MKKALSHRPLIWLLALLVFAGSLSVYATALTEDRRTPSVSGDNLVASLTILDTEIIYSGGIVAVTYDGEVQMASDTAGLRVVGTAGEYVDNTDDGELLRSVNRGIRRFNNSATYAVARTAIGMPCYVEDDNTVAGRSTNYVAAGLVHDVDSDGVWVDQRPAALEKARRLTPQLYAAKTANYTLTSAEAFAGRTVFNMDGATGGAVELTLPSAVPGMRFGVFRGSATAGDDVSVQAAAGDVVEASDGFTAAAKQVDNTVDAISQIIWYECVDAGTWKAVTVPTDWASWVINNS